MLDAENLGQKKKNLTNNLSRNHALICMVYLQLKLDEIVLLYLVIQIPKR